MSSEYIGISSSPSVKKVYHEFISSLGNRDVNMTYCGRWLKSYTREYKKGREICLICEQGIRRYHL